jgi:uncharacterized protein
MGLIDLVTPHLCVESVLELDAPRLRSLGLEALLLDVDCTLKRYREEAVSPPVAAWLEGLRRAGIAVCLMSNGRSERIGRFAKKLNLPFVAKALKPLPFGCKTGLRTLGRPRQQVAMVGDQVFADIMAGRLAGLFSILVRPIHPEDEPWYTRLKRPLEQSLIHRFFRNTQGAKRSAEGTASS